MNLDDLIVKRGDPVLPAWRRLLEWVRGLKIIAGPGIRLNMTPQGVVATLEREVPPWQHPWKTSAGDVANIRAGTVRGITARVKDLGGKLRRLDGRDSDGALSDDGLPQMEVDFNLHDERGRAWLVVRLKIGEDGGLDPDDPEAVIVEQVDEIPEGAHAVALIQFDESRSTVEEVFQISHHNLDFAVSEDQETGASRTLFFPV